MMVFKSPNDSGPKYMYIMFTKTSHFTGRNHATTDLKLPLGKSTVGQKSLSYIGTKVFKSFLK